MASVEDDGYAFQAKSLTTLPVEMLTRVLENVSLEDAMRFGQTNREAFAVVSRNPNFQIAPVPRNFFRILTQDLPLRGYVDPVITCLKRAQKNFVETKRKITYVGASSMTGLTSSPLVQMGRTPSQMDSSSG